MTEARSHAHAPLGIHLSLACAVLTACLVALTALPVLAPAILLLFAPLAIRSAHFWGLPGLVVVAGMTQGLGFFKLAQLDGMEGFSRPAMAVEMAASGAVALLSGHLHRRAHQAGLLQSEHAADAERQRHEMLAKLEHEKGLLAAARARSAHLERTHALADALAGSRDYQARLELACSGLLGLLPEAELWVLVPTAQGLSVAQRRTAQGALPPGEATEFDHWVAARRMSLLVADIERDIRFKGQGGSGLRCIASAPVVHGERLVAVLRLGSGRANAFSHEDLRLLGLLCEVLAASEGLPLPRSAAGEGEGAWTSTACRGAGAGGWGWRPAFSWA